MIDSRKSTGDNRVPFYQFLPPGLFVLLIKARKVRYLFGWLALWKICIWYIITLQASERLESFS